MTSPDHTRPVEESITEPPPAHRRRSPPFGGLPAAESWKELTNNQLQLVVLEAQFTDVPDPISAGDGLLVRDAAVAHGLDQPRVESAVRHDVQVQLADNGDHVLKETVTKGWRYTVGDDALVAPFCSLRRSSYKPPPTGPLAHPSADPFFTCYLRSANTSPLGA